MPFEWQVRKRVAIWVTAIFSKLHGDEAAKGWLWGLTPFPADVPRWKECVQGVVAALLPGKLHDDFILERHYEVDRSIDRAMKGLTAVNMFMALYSVN